MRHRIEHLGRLGRAGGLAVLLAWVCIGFTGCQSTERIVVVRDLQPITPTGEPARSLMMPPLEPGWGFRLDRPDPRVSPSPATVNGLSSQPWYASRLDDGPAAFAGFQSPIVTESITRTSDQQRVFNGRVRDNFQQQRVTRSRVFITQ